MMPRKWTLMGKWIDGTLPGMNPLLVSGPVPNEGETLTLIEQTPTTLHADEAFERIQAMHEYWNRDYNEQAMRDALDFIMGECAALLAKAQPARKGEG